MKKKTTITISILLALLVLGIFWYKMPVKLTSINPEAVSELYVFSGMTGKELHITEPDEIRHIIENFNTVKLQKDGISLFRMGYRLKMTIYRKDGKAAPGMNEFIINGPTIRKDPFFYRVVEGELDYSYIEELVEQRSQYPQDVELPAAEEVTPDPPSPESDTLNAYIAVLTGKSGFTDVDSGTSLTVAPETCAVTDAWNRTTTSKRFTLLDLDGNNASELILWMKEGPDDRAGFWLLWHQDGSVWGQNLTYRCFEQLKWDGTFHNSGDFSQDGTTDGIARMRLTPDGWYSEYIASHTAQTDDDFNIVRESWEVNGKEAASGEFMDIYMKQTDKPTAVWYLFNKTNLAEFGIITDDAEPLPATSAQIQSAFTKVLTENGAFYDRSAQKESTIQDYCQEATARIGWPVEIIQTASVDMDADGVEEVILNIAVNSNVDTAVWVLHYQNGEIQGDLYYHRQLGDIKTDGTFWWSGNASNSGSARLVFDADQWRYEDAPAEGFDEKENIRWVDFPGIEPVETVEHTEPWTLFETVFMPFARGEISRITEDYTAYLDRLGYAWTEDEGIISVKDPERPGCYLSGSLGGNEVATLWYSYIIQDHPLSIDQQIQRGVKVKFSDGIPQYFTQVTFWDDGTEVAAPEELDCYLTCPGLRPEETPEGYYRKKMTAVLTDAEDFLSNDRQDPEYGSVNMKLSTYLEVLNQETGFNLIFSRIATVDMDNDEFPEVALTVAPKNYPDSGFYLFILHYSEQAIWGQLFEPQDMHELKADGTFGWFVNRDENGAARMVFDERNWHRQEVSFDDFGKKENAQWHDFLGADLDEILK